MSTSMPMPSNASPNANPNANPNAIPPMQDTANSTHAQTQQQHTHLPQVLASIEDAKQQEDRQFVTALARGLSLLMCFERHDALSHQQLCQMTDLPKATVTRLLYTLLSLGFIRQLPQGEYQLGHAALRLQQPLLAEKDWLLGITPLLKQFAHRHQVSVSLATHVQGQMRYLVSCRSPARLSVNLQVGSMVPLAQTAIGRAWYAMSDEPQRQQALAALQAQMNVTDYEQARLGLAAAKDSYQQQGFASSQAEFSSEIMAVAVAVFEVSSGRYRYSLNASVPTGQWQMQALVAKVVPELQALAQQIVAL